MAVDACTLAECGHAFAINRGQGLPSRVKFRLYFGISIVWSVELGVPCRSGHKKADVQAEYAPYQHFEP
jgi:hypothetical protein